MFEFMNEYLTFLWNHTQNNDRTHFRAGLKPRLR